MITASKLWLVVASLFFYAYWKISYLPLILLSLTFNFLIGASLSGVSGYKIDRRLILITGIALNLSLLAYFKYTNFLIGNVNAITGLDFGSVDIVLPLAISFFTISTNSVFG